MGELINFLEYRKKKEESEVDSLRQELAALIEEMGGVHIAPMMILGSYPHDYSGTGDPWCSMLHSSSWSDFEYTYGDDDKKD